MITNNAMIRLWIGFTRSVETCPADGPPIGLAIDVATRLRWGEWDKGPHGKWTFPDGPATHAFVVVSPTSRPVDGHRIDAVHPATRIAPYTGQEGDEKLFHVSGFYADVNAGIRQAYAEVGTPYDMAQLLFQTLAIFAKGNPLMQRIPFQARKGAGICTETACRVLMAVGGEWGQVGKSVLEDDHYPEELARRVADLHFALNSSINVTGE